MKAIGIDFGTKRIGVAASDDEGRVAFGLRALDARGSLRAQLADIISEHFPEIIVVGNPLSLDGSAGPMSEKAKKFKRRLEEWFEIPCVLWDERMTSAQVDNAPAQGQNKSDRDIAAATIILQSYLDSVNSVET